jgi:hypothetical protein
MKSYGAWTGNPKGNPEDPDRCVESVSDGYLFYQCKRKRGYGPGGLYCKQHAKLKNAVKPLGEA